MYANKSNKLSRSIFAIQNSIQKTRFKELVDKVLSLIGRQMKCTEVDRDRVKRWSNEMRMAVKRLQGGGEATAGMRCGAGREL